MDLGEWCLKWRKNEWERPMRGVIERTFMVWGKQRGRCKEWHLGVWLMQLKRWGSIRWDDYPPWMQFQDGDVISGNHEITLGQVECYVHFRHTLEDIKVVLNLREELWARDTVKLGANSL